MTEVITRKPQWGRWRADWRARARRGIVSIAAGKQSSNSNRPASGPQGLRALRAGILFISGVCRRTVPAIRRRSDIPRPWSPWVRRAMRISWKKAASAIKCCVSRNSATTGRAGDSRDVPPYVCWRTEHSGREGDNCWDDGIPSHSQGVVKWIACCFPACLIFRGGAT